MDTVLSELLTKTEFADMDQMSKLDEESDKIFRSRPAVLQVYNVYIFYFFQWLVS